MLGEVIRINSRVEEYYELCTRLYYMSYYNMYQDYVDFPISVLSTLYRSLRAEVDIEIVSEVCAKLDRLSDAGC